MLIYMLKIVCVYRCILCIFILLLENFKIESNNFGDSCNFILIRRSIMFEYSRNIFDIDV